VRVIVTEHAHQRLKDGRQSGIRLPDLIRAAQRIPGRVPVATRFRGNVAGSGQGFDVVVKDTPVGRLIITVIGK
jgi:hypothetical protein